MARRKRTSRTYSLEHLLARQPKTIRKHPYYRRMIEYYELSPRLRNLRISRRCYSLLNRATVDPQNLRYFYRTYRLPKDPFFPLFFLIKRDYQKKQTQRKEERAAYIAEKMRSLPEDVLAFIKFLAMYEQKLHRRKQYPLWSTSIFPSTKKRVREYASYSVLEWIPLLREYCVQLENRYPAHTSVYSDQLLACFILNCRPSAEPPFYPQLTLVHQSYRRLSKLYHPDHGGDPEYFMELKWARDTLVHA